MAHISPKEAMMLKSKGGAGTVHPVTGLLEFSADAKNGRKYIWHTAGNGKVRSSHADRDGKTFSWDNPPEGGHPGEAPNCRCWAEDVVDKQRCEELSRLIKAMESNQKKAHERFNRANERYNKAKATLKRLEDKCQNELDSVPRKVRESSAKGAVIGGVTGNIPGAVIGALRGAAKGIGNAAWDVYETCMAEINNSQEQANYDEAKKERDSAEFWLKSYQEDLDTYRKEYEHGGCENGGRS